MISLLITLFSGWQSWLLHTHFEEMSRKHIVLTKDVGRIMLLDEGLTMSARMAAATGDFSYEKRYDQLDEQLTRKINEVRTILPAPEIKPFVGETDEANLALVKMERQAFALAHQGKREEATALLVSTEYMRLKKVYAGGMEKTVNAANNLIEKDVLHLRLLSSWLTGISAVGTLLLLVTWFFAIRSARSWATERIIAEDALRNAQEELVRKESLAVLGKIADNVGHELRNPLGVMNNAVYFLQTVLSDADENVKEYLDIIHDEIESADHILSDLLDAVRTKPPQPESVEVGELLTQILQASPTPESVTVQLDIPDRFPSLLVDPLQIQQVFRNLITNAMEAMPEGGMLEIRARAETDGKALTISVCDSGIGMTPEILPNLFQPLFTTKTRRIGLGLAVVKKLTEANGGSVAVQSTPGKGSTFFVTLPAVALAEGGA
jgi:signal transduction histidine kinase